MRQRVLFERLEELEGRHDAQAELEKSGILSLMVAAFLGTADSEVMALRRKAYIRFQSTLDYIEMHLGESLRIGALAGLAHLERTYFSRTFQKCLGIKPVEYVMRRRVERAKQRLWSTDAPLRAIADGLGFSDAFHFSKCFKRLTGLTPSDFRALRQGREAR